MEALTIIQAALGIVETFGPLIPEIVGAVPTIASDAAKVAKDATSLNATSTISDLEALFASIPTGVISQVITASKSLKI